MIDYSKILEIPPYSLLRHEKEKLLSERIRSLTRHHYNNCFEYRRIIDIMGYDIDNDDNYYDIPFLPVRLFKEIQLKSISDEEIFKTMTSSGTTGQSVSKIYLNKETASNQQKTLAKIVSNYTGSTRMPMIIIDCPNVLKDRSMFSARGAGILGFSLFGTKKIYALDNNMELDVNALEKFLEENKGKRILLFGFTFMIWQHFYKELLKMKDKGIKFDLSECIMIHGGGWKKLTNQAVSRVEFEKNIYDVCGLKNIYDYYGMVEQTGCVYMQCECGHLHASIFSDVITRRKDDFSRCDYGEEGIIQVVSMLPESYPGHSLLTEDEGIILGEDDCKCGRKGKYFKVIGRLKNAEIRGCSDTYASMFR